MKVLCWNVQGRIGATLRRQLDAVLDRTPDIVALQELTEASFPTWRERLQAADYFVASTIDLIAAPYPVPPYPTPPFPPPRRGPVHAQIRRRNFNLTAARHPIEPLDGLSFEDPEEERFSFPEKHLAVRVTIAGREVRVHNTHVPHGSGRGVLKVHAFEAIRRRMDADRGVPRLLCGDFNAPWAEGPEGPRTRIMRKWPEEILARWEGAEAALFTPGELGDVYREVHPRGEPPISHWTGRGMRRVGHRYDYIFASREFETENCEYLTDWIRRDGRGRRLSDHAPVEASLSVRG